MHRQERYLDLRAGDGKKEEEEEEVGVVIKMVLFN